MITNKDIRVENGNLVLNGDKYPLEGQSPEAIMQIVEDNSDTTPTENSNNPVKSGGIYSKIGDLTQTGLTGASVAEQLGDLKTSFTETTLATKSFKASSTNYEYTGCSYTVPQGKTAILYAKAMYSSNKPVGVLLSWNSNSLNIICATELSGEWVARSPVAIIAGGNTVYAWEKRNSVPGADNESTIMGILI